MKKVINGRLYNTDTATCLGGYSFSSTRDFRYIEEYLYRTKRGSYFLHGEGGPLTKYREQVGQNEWGYGEDILPLTEEEAREWAEVHMDGDEYIDAFGAPEEA